MTILLLAPATTTPAAATAHHRTKHRAPLRDRLGPDAVAREGGDPL
jgi:hypothetical protein